MILLDPDLDSEPDPRGPNSKRAPANRPATIDRNSRVPTTRTLTRFLTAAQAAVRLRGHVSVLLTTDRNIRRINRQFRGKDKATDVLSFPAEPRVQKQENVAGDLAVSVQTALRQAREQRHALTVELKVLMLHGLLHLAGYDHERDNGLMARREQVLRTRLKLPRGLIERSGDPTLSPETRRQDGARNFLLSRSGRQAATSRRTTGVLACRSSSIRARYKSIALRSSSVVASLRPARTVTVLARRYGSTSGA